MVYEPRTYAKEFVAGWATMDLNGHMANAAYLDLAADVRIAFFAEHGFPPDEFRRLAIGPVVQKDELHYFREVRLFDSVTVTYAPGNERERVAFPGRKRDLVGKRRACCNRPFDRRLARHPRATAGGSTASTARGALRGPTE